MLINTFKQIITKNMAYVMQRESGEYYLNIVSPVHSRGNTCHSLNDESELNAIYDYLKKMEYYQVNN